MLGAKMTRLALQEPEVFDLDVAVKGQRQERHTSGDASTRSTATGQGGSRQAQVEGGRSSAERAELVGAAEAAE
jgi:hypothetical protein